MRLGTDSFILSYLPQLLLSKRVAEGGPPGEAECGGLWGEGGEMTEKLRVHRDCWREKMFGLRRINWDVEKG